jgi:hypothetical protein
MSVIDGNALGSAPRRRVSIKSDGDDFVVSFQPENIVVFRHNEVNALRRICRSLHWEIIWEIVDDTARDTTGHSVSV